VEGLVPHLVGPVAPVRGVYLSVSYDHDSIEFVTPARAHLRRLRAGRGGRVGTANSSTGKWADIAGEMPSPRTAPALRTPIQIS